MTFKTAGRQLQAGLARQMKSYLRPRHVFSSDLPSQDTSLVHAMGRMAKFCRFVALVLVLLFNSVVTGEYVRGPLRPESRDLSSTGLDGLTYSADEKHGMLKDSFARQRVGKLPRRCFSLWGNR